MCQSLLSSSKNLSSPAKGFTILELMIVITVIAVLATIAVPSFNDIIKRNTIAAQNNELIALIHLARNEAIRRNPVGNETVTVEFVRNTAEATWEGYVRPPGEAGTEGCPPGAIRCSFQTRTLLGADDWATGSFLVRFDNRGYSVDDSGGIRSDITMRIVHQACDSERHARQVRVLPAGQVTSELVACSEDEEDE